MIELRWKHSGFLNAPGNTPVPVFHLEYREDISDLGHETDWQEVYVEGSLPDDSEKMRFRVTGVIGNNAPKIIVPDQTVQKING